MSSGFALTSKASNRETKAYITAIAHIGVCSKLHCSSGNGRLSPHIHTLEKLSDQMWLLFVHVFIYFKMPPGVD